MNAKRVSSEALVCLKNLSASTKYFDEVMFGEYLSAGGYASAGFAEAVKMPRAEAQGTCLDPWKEKNYKIIKTTF